MDLSSEMINNNHCTKYNGQIFLEAQLANHLINETSPYLLQHAHNPVNWYPWGDEALQISKKEDRPILLSIGYLGVPHARKYWTSWVPDNWSILLPKGPVSSKVFPNFFLSQTDKN